MGPWACLAAEPRRAHRRGRGVCTPVVVPYITVSGGRGGGVPTAIEYPIQGDGPPTTRRARAQRAGRACPHIPAVGHGGGSSHRCHAVGIGRPRPRTRPGRTATAGRAWRRRRARPLGAPQSRFFQSNVPLAAAAELSGGRRARNGPPRLGGGVRLPPPPIASLFGGCMPAGGPWQTTRLGLGIRLPGEEGEVRRWRPAVWLVAADSDGPTPPSEGPREIFWQRPPPPSRTAPSCCQENAARWRRPTEPSCRCRAGGPTTPARRPTAGGRLGCGAVEGPAGRRSFATHPSGAAPTFGWWIRRIPCVVWRASEGI